MPWIGLRDAKAHHGEVIHETEQYTNQAGLDNSSARLIPKGAVCLSRTASVGYVTVLGRPMATSQDFVNWVCGDELDPHFLRHLLVAEKQALLRFASGAVHSTIYYPEAKAFHICMPPLAEQRRIVARLDEAFAAIQTAIAAAEKNLANTQRLFQSLIDAEIEGVAHTSGPARPLEELVSDLLDRRGVTPKKLDSAFVDSGHRVISAKSIRDRRIDFSQADARFVDGATYGRWMRTPLLPSDVLLTSEAPLGEPALVEEELDWCIGQRLFCLRPESSILRGEFLYWALQSRQVRGELLSRATGATAQGIRQALLRKVPVPCPSIAHQDSVLERLRSQKLLVDRYTDLASRRRALLGHLRSSLLLAVFRPSPLSSAPSAEGKEATARNVILNEQSAPSRRLSSTDVHAGILAIAFRHHDNAGKLRYLGHVKGEKIAHLVENHVGVSLGRSPKKDAAGPNDYPHLKKVESRAKKAGFFTVTKVGERYEFNLGSQFQKLIDKAEAALGQRLAEVQALLDLLTPLTTQQAEIVATVYAAWNNLLLAGDVAPADEAIVREAREDWHPKKLDIPRQKFFKAIEWMQKKELVPRGKGQPVE